MTISISPFTDADAAEIAAWPRDEEEARNWAGQGAEFPVDAQHIRRWQKDPDVHAYTGWQSTELVAYGELWVDRSEHEIELARVIVRPSLRGAGMGRAFVAYLCEEAATFGEMDIFLRVTPDNQPAICCYQHAGFTVLPQAQQLRYNESQPVKYVWMRYSPVSYG